MRKNKTYNLHKIKIGIVRIEQKNSGFFDGRFVQRSEPSQKQYSRKCKHKHKRRRED